MAKKISRKEVRRRMKMDEMEEARHWIHDFWEDHGKLVSGIVGGVLVISLIVYLYMDANTKNREHAASLYSTAMEKAEAPDQSAEAISLLDEISEKYASTPTMPFALLLKAKIMADQGDKEGSLAVYDEVLTKNVPEVSSAALLSKAVVLEDLNRDSDAIDAYNRILKNYAKSGYESEAQFRLGQLYERLGENQQAIEMYQSIPEDSIWYRPSVMKVEWLQAPVEPLDAA